MADNYKILAQSSPYNTLGLSSLISSDITYKVPEGTEVAISSISVLNQGDQDSVYSLGIVKSEDVSSSYENKSYNVSFSSRHYTTDGYTFLAMGNPFSEQIVSFANNQDRVIVLAAINNDNSYTSTDFINWTQIAQLGTSPYTGVAYGADKFVLTASSSSNPLSSTSGISTDGINWTAGSLPVAASGYGSIVYANDMFLTVQRDSNNYFTSTDGVNWTSQSNSLLDGGYVYQVRYMNGLFTINMSNSNFLISTDGTNWEERLAPLGGTTPSSILYFNNKFITHYNSLDKTYYSTDGYSWFEVVSENPYFSYILPIQDDKVFGYVDAYSPNDTKASAYVSTDGVNFVFSRDISMPHAGSIQSLASNSLLFSTTQYEVKTISDYQTIIPEKTINTGDVEEIVGGITLSAGDEIRIYSESPDITAHIYGVELS